MTLRIDPSKITPEDKAKADDLRRQARESAQRARESWERSDTDGFVSQWASNITHDELMLKADLIEAGGSYERDLLFDLQGNLVLAKEIETRYGWAWMILDPNNPTGPALGFFNESKAQKRETKIKNDARKGYYVGRGMVKGYVKIIASGTGLSGAASARPGVLPWRDETTGGYVVTEIIDNGQDG
jgi:hypothetical protein